MTVWVIETSAGEPVACGIGTPGADVPEGHRLVTYVSALAIRALTVVMRHASAGLRDAAYAGTTPPHLVGLKAGRSDGLDMAAALLEGLL